MLLRLLVGIAAALCALALVACGGESGAESGAVATQAPDGIAPVVVVSTTILADIVDRIGCGQVEVESLLAPGQDPHSGELSARQAADLRDAGLIVAIGLGLEESFTDVLLDAEDTGTSVLFLGPRLDPIPVSALEEHGHADDLELDEHEGPLDPHVWADPRRMIEAVRLIAPALGQVTGFDHSDCADKYVAELEQLDADVAAELESVPSASRMLVSNHSALGYFAERYGFTVLDTIIPGGTTLAEPSSADIVALVETVDETGVVAIFADVSASTELARLVASEASRAIEVVPLFSGSLGERGSGAESYVAMMRTNAQRIADALSDAS